MPQSLIQRVARQYLLGERGHWQVATFDWKDIEGMEEWLRWAMQENSLSVLSLNTCSDQYAFLATDNTRWASQLAQALPGVYGVPSPEAFLASYWVSQEKLRRKPPVFINRTAAEVGTDTATLYSIAPEALYRIVSEGNWEAFAAGLWGPGDHGDTNTEVTWEAMSQIIRQHGGAVSQTGHDGGFDVKVPGATSEKGYMPPYGTPEYGLIQKVAGRFIRRMAR